MLEKESRLFLRKVHPQQHDRPCDFVKVVRSKKGRTFFLPEHKSVVVIPAATDSWRCEEAPVPKGAYSIGMGPEIQIAYSSS